MFSTAVNYQNLIDRRPPGAVTTLSIVNWKETAGFFDF